MERSLVFQASTEVLGRAYRGLNTHLMLLHPSTDVFAILAANAALGHFVPFTLTEQDVVESTLPPNVGRAGGSRLRTNGSVVDSTTAEPAASSIGRAPDAGFSVPAVAFPAHMHDRTLLLFSAFGARGIQLHPRCAPYERRAPPWPETRSVHPCCMLEAWPCERAPISTGCGAAKSRAACHRMRWGVHPCVWQVDGRCARGEGHRGMAQCAV